MSDIKAIPTRYAGCYFRSRLEARWAVFFDCMGIKWEYEKEGYELENVGLYLPDFYLPDKDCFVEVKGCFPTDEEVRKCMYLNDQTHKEVWLFYGSKAFQNLRRNIFDVDCIYESYTDCSGYQIEGGSSDEFRRHSEEYGFLRCWEQGLDEITYCQYQPIPWLDRGVINKATDGIRVSTLNSLLTRLSCDAASEASFEYAGKDIIDKRVRFINTLRSSDMLDNIKYKYVTCDYWGDPDCYNEDDVFSWESYPHR